MRIDNLLRKYKTLGIDVDNTIIGHPNSPVIWDYVERNPFNQQFFIVTFRSGGWEHDVWDDLRKHGSLLTQAHFADLHACPHELWEGNQKKRLIVTLDELKDDPYMVWKGAVCAEHGIEVLIDDMTHNVIYGCQKHGVDHIHPDDLV